MTQNKPLSATETPQNLESALSATLENNQELIQEVQQLKNSVQGLAKRLNATIKAGEKGNISDDSVQQELVSMNILDLKKRIEVAVTAGVFVKADEVQEGSFLVTRELNKENEVINPRLQFPLAQIEPTIASQLMGKKAGEVLELEQSNVEILEIYLISAPSEPDLSPLQAEANEEVDEEVSKAKSKGAKSPKAEKKTKAKKVAKKLK